MENDKLFDLMTKMYSEMQDMNVKIHSEMQDMNVKIHSEMQDTNVKIHSEMQDMNTNLSSKIDSIERDVKETKSLQIRMEQTLTEKLSALFDGYKQNTDQLNRISEEVAKHEEVIIRRVK